MLVPAKYDTYLVNNHSKNYSKISQNIVFEEDMWS